jgi:hypothetical protein
MRLILLIHPGILQREINEPPKWKRVGAGGASMLIGG